VNERSIAQLGMERIQKGPLREQVRAQIKRLILSNRLRPGQPIVIQQLASELGVSQTPVREALAMLQHDGLVQMRPYEHSRIAKIAASDVREVWDMRLLLEPWAIESAALSLPVYELDTMAEALSCARENAKVSRFDSHLETDIKLHAIILKATGNGLFERLAQLVNDRSVRIRSLVESIAPVNEVLTIIDEHCALLEALKAREPELARERLIAHLEAGKVRTLAALEQLEAGKG
jgi:DNA-binding GntR family transcriptional regulator